MSASREKESMPPPNPFARFAAIVEFSTARLATGAWSNSRYVSFAIPPPPSLARLPLTVERVSRVSE